MNVAPVWEATVDVFAKNTVVTSLFQNNLYGEVRWTLG